VCSKNQVGGLSENTRLDKDNGKMYGRFKEKLSGEKNGRSGAQNLPLGREPTSK